MSIIQASSVLVIALYLIAFFAGSALAARAVGRSIWLFASAAGPDRFAAVGFRASFVLALCSPLLYQAAPALSALDPVWTPGLEWLALPGHVLAVTGAMVAFAAQMAMGASWRVGVKAEDTGDLVSEGLYTISRNPTFLGQATLLGGVALSIPTLPGILAVLLFLGSAMTQIRSEERALLHTHGEAFKAFCARTPRWIGRPQRTP